MENRNPSSQIPKKVGMIMKNIKFISGLLFLSVGAYLLNGGWADNFGSLYRNYKESGLSKREFMASIVNRK